MGLSLNDSTYVSVSAVTPNRIEFWQGRPNRLHDRFLYILKENGEWQISRLAP